MTSVSLGLDFGTESVRALLVDTEGNPCGIGESVYQHGQIVDSLPHSDVPLPPRYALQSPDDWLNSAAEATGKALLQSGLKAESVVGIGVDFTSCTMLPTLRDGTPLCCLEQWADKPLAWPKLWKHHGAIEQTARMNEVARERAEPFLQRYGGTIGLEWFFPKMLETIEQAPEVAEAAQVWLEGGDWLVWQLVGGDAENLTRSTCQAGYKAMWSAADGYPSADYLAALDPRLAEAAAQRMPGILRAPGELAGGLDPAMADKFGLLPGTPVAAAIIDAHAAVPGVGAASPGTLVMVLGTSSCHMLNATIERDVPGVAGMVAGGILPGLVGYETGQAAVGDAFAWLRKLLGLDSFEGLTADAMRLPPGAEGVRCVDWMNGCRTPLMDGNLRGMFAGLGLNHGPAHLYLALLEASAFGLRWIVELLRENDVPIESFIATGGLPHHNRAIVEVYADVLNETIEIHPSKQGPATGAAVLGMMVSQSDQVHFASVSEAATAMAAVPESERDLISARPERAAVYDDLYIQYRRWAEMLTKMES